MATYTVRVRDCNSWSPTTGECNVIRDCGHRHKSINAACDCLRKLRGDNHRSGSWSCNANWYHGRVEEYTATEQTEEVANLVSQMRYELGQ